MKTVAELMLRDPVTIRPSESLLDAERIMRLARIRHLPVVQDGRLAGILTHRDVLRATLAGVEETSPADRTAHLRAIPVERVMTRSPRTVSPRATLAEAATEMLRHKIGCLLVVEPHDPLRPLGLLTESDLVRAAYAPDFRGASD